MFSEDQHLSAQSSLIYIWDTNTYSLRSITLSFKSTIFSIWVFLISWGCERGGTEIFEDKKKKKKKTKSFIFGYLYQWLECFLVLNPPEGDGFIRVVGCRIHQARLPMAEQGGRVFLYTRPAMKPIILLFLYWYVHNLSDLFHKSCFFFFFLDVNNFV